ncbi:hypothetical protein H4CHR_01539 [Variovorax sp. PBS-H4]|uniref:hypothetical protein n=1 Tax=Variovorax sp. PBS-H4 TaxID=434008 RepID=UPI0013168168|nr:hypothetical protein [Variovorax sp. PBS-H4]VTU25161.1 hypothetical protein H4CHR_01539 [Variovorax sp. PBS-H4]
MADPTNSAPTSPIKPAAFIEHTDSPEDGPHQELVWCKDDNKELEGPMYEYTPLYRIESLGLADHDISAIAKALQGKAVTISRTPYEDIDKAIAWVMGVEVGKALAAAPSAPAGQAAVATVHRGGTAVFGRATVLVRWEDGAEALPDGEHKLYAFLPTAGQAEGTAWDFTAWLQRLMELADAYWDASPAARYRFRSPLLEHATNAGMHWRSRAALASPPPAVHQSPVQPAGAIVETIKTELDALGRLWMDYGKQAGGFNTESGTLYGQIQFTRAKVLDYVAMLATPQPAAQSAVSDEQIMDACRPFAEDGGRWPSSWIDAGRAVLALASSAQAGEPDGIWGRPSRLFIDMCLNELERGSLTSLPRKAAFAEREGMSLADVDTWMYAARQRFAEAVRSLATQAERPAGERS